MRAIPQPLDQAGAKRLGDDVERGLHQFFILMQGMIVKAVLSDAPTYPVSGCRLDRSDHLRQRTMRP